MLRQITLYDDETGEFISSNTSKTGSKLKEGWIVVYKEPLIKLLQACPNYATLKVYLRIAAAQDYDTVTYISTRFLANDLNLAYQTVWNAVKWLINNDYIKRAKNDTGASGFIVNPLVSTCGKKNLEEKLNAFDSDQIHNPDPVPDDSIPVMDFSQFEEPPDDSTKISFDMFQKLAKGSKVSLEDFNAAIIEDED